MKGQAYIGSLLKRGRAARKQSLEESIPPTTEVLLSFQLFSEGQADSLRKAARQGKRILTVGRPASGSVLLYKWLQSETDPALREKISTAERIGPFTGRYDVIVHLDKWHIVNIEGL